MLQPLRRTLVVAALSACAGTKSPPAESETTGSPTASDSASQATSHSGTTTDSTSSSHEQSATSSNSPVTPGTTTGPTTAPSSTTNTTATTAPVTSSASSNSSSAAETNTSAGEATSSTATGASNDSSGTSSSSSETAEAEPEPRTQCPEAPPAAQKDPAADRSLSVSKDEYPQMLDAQPPFEGTRGSLPWHLYTPEQAKAEGSERFPLLVVLHGGYGREVEDGNILVDVAQYLLGSANGLLTSENRAAYPTFILLPHCRVEEGCNFGSNEWASAGGANYQIQPEPSVAGGTALELIAHVMGSYAVDKRRVYITGNSMGGGGTWEFAQRNPNLFAAALPVSGHTPALAQLTTISDAKLPVWAFGAENDYTNPYTDTVNAINALGDASGCAWLTTYNDTAHDDGLWSSPYLEPGLWPWLFAQTNSAAP